MVEGAYTKSNIIHVLPQLPKDVRGGLKELRALFAGNKQWTMLFDQIEQNRLVLAQKVQSLSGQMKDLTKIELPGAEEAFRVVRRLVNLCLSKIEQAKLPDIGSLIGRCASPN